MERESTWPVKRGSRQQLHRFLNPSKKRGYSRLLPGRLKILKSMKLTHRPTTAFPAEHTSFGRCSSQNLQLSRKKMSPHKSLSLSTLLSKLKRRILFQSLRFLALCSRAAFQEDHPRKRKVHAYPQRRATGKKKISLLRRNKMTH